MDLLQHLRFPVRFRDWVSALLSTATSRVLINGVLGDPLKHGRGLCQGDPLSPLLFVLAIDPLHHLLSKATAQGHLHSLCGRAPTVRASLYADDPAIFVKPTKEDVQFLAATLASFGEVTGLVNNCAKSLVAPIQCDGINLDNVLHAFPAVRSSFPMRYLGLPLSVKRLKRIHFQHLEDKIACKLPPWQGRHVAVAGRTVLVKAVLTAIAIYHLTPLDIPVEVLQKIDSIRRAYLWAGTDKVSGGKCKVNWDLVCKPKNKGGLGVLNLNKFAKALRLRWLWFEWKDKSKPWIGMEVPCTEDDRHFFAAATTVTVGNGRTARFWNSSWLQGLRPHDIAPGLFDLSRKKNSLVQQAMAGNQWIANIDSTNGLSLAHIQ